MLFAGRDRDRVIERERGQEGLDIVGAVAHLALGVGTETTHIAGRGQHAAAKTSQRYGLRVLDLDLSAHAGLAQALPARLDLAGGAAAVTAQPIAVVAALIPLLNIVAALG